MLDFSPRRAELVLSGSEAPQYSSCWHLGQQIRVYVTEYVGRKEGGKQGKGLRIHGSL